MIAGIFSLVRSEPGHAKKQTNESDGQMTADRHSSDWEAQWSSHPVGHLRNQPYSPTATIAMVDIKTVLYSAVNKILSGQNYEESLAYYRFWFEVGQTHFEIPSDQIFDAIWNKRATDSITKRSQPVHSNPGGIFGQSAFGQGAFGQVSAFGQSQPSIFGQPSGFGQPGIFGSHPVSQEPSHISYKLIHPTIHSILRFASDAESDRILAPHNSELQHRLCAKILQDFFNSNLTAAWHEEFEEQSAQDSNSTFQCFYGDANFVAHWANLGYVEEVDVRNRILQSLISYPKLHGHQADALIILFKIAGATFEAHVDPAVIDRCFKLLKDNYSRDSTDWELFQVRVPRSENGHRAETISRRYLRYGSAAGRDFLHHLRSPPVDRGLLARAREILLQFPLLRP